MTTAGTMPPAVFGGWLLHGPDDAATEPTVPPKP
jgi:hypothetical protein